MDDGCFNGNFSSEGLAKLREKVTEKLHELMSDYTDETLVEYVVVLLKNRKSKDEARKDLNVFLGEESDSFVSWLWDHLSTNSHLYTQEQADNSNNVIKGEIDGAKETRDSRRIQKRDQNEKFPLRSIVKDILHREERSSNSNGSDPPPSRDIKKRIREEDQRPRKRDPQARPAISAPRRLLQFAVRDAVKTAQRDCSKTVPGPDEPSPKRLRSVVQTSECTRDTDMDRDTGVIDTVPGRKLQRLRSVLSVPGSAIALKAAAEAADDVSRVIRPCRSVFDRLAQDTPQKDETINEMTEIDKDGDEMADIAERGPVDYTEPETVHSGKVVGVSVDASMCEVGPADRQVSVDGGGAHQSPVGPTEEMETCMAAAADDVKEVEVADAQKETQKIPSIPTVLGSYATSHPLDDGDSRTLFVSNVHFAATKDALSRHFNKFGAVLKVVIVNDPASGQPTGSAYVEFLHKESAELALSVNGTSFMSRILKVVRRSSHEYMSWWGVGRSSPFGSRIVGNIPYSRSSFRGRPSPMKAGARSLQWKREPPSTTQPTAGTNLDANVQ